MTHTPPPPNHGNLEAKSLVTSPAQLTPLQPRALGEETKTFGERAHRFVQNIVINHGVNLALSFWFAKAADFGGSSALAKGIHALNGKAHNLVKSFPSLKIPISIFWLSSGGTLLVPIVRGMDESGIKLSIVKRFDRWRDALRTEAPNEAELGQREAAYARIATEEHPGWGRTFIARLSGILFNMGTEIALQKAHRHALEVPGADPEKDYGYGWFGKKVIDDFKQAGRPLASEKATWRGEWLARTIPLEVLSTVNAVAFYNVVYRWFQKDGSKKHAEQVPATSAAAIQPIAAVENNAAETGGMEADAEDKRMAARFTSLRRTPQTEPRSASFSEAARMRAEPAERVLH